MVVIKNGEKSPVAELIGGQPNILSFNLPVKYRIIFSSGSVVEGTLTPNNNLTITPMEDFVDLTFTIDEESRQPLHLIKE
jgi:hypothetical protein